MVVVELNIPHVKLYPFKIKVPDDTVNVFVLPKVSVLPKLQPPAAFKAISAVILAPFALMNRLGFVPIKEKPKVAPDVNVEVAVAVKLPETLKKKLPIAMVTVTPANIVRFKQSTLAPSVIV